jgi:RNA polymerase sigma factor (sigma-70 family)
VEAVWRIESARLIAALCRMVGDVGLAEELAQDALLAALEQWPEAGVPEKPGAWLMTTARNRALDHLRRRKRIDRSQAELGRRLQSRQTTAQSEVDRRLDQEIFRRASEHAALEAEETGADDLLRLVFTACHPALSTEARVALTLRLLGGLTTAEIARAFLAPEPTIAQRIVRAKRTLSQEQVEFEVPAEAELPERVASVLEVIYLIFNEGYTATAGDDWMRPGLCEDALRLGRILAELMPQEPEVHGLVGLMEIQASRSRARLGKSGEPILLMDQNRALWDQLLIRRGLAALERSGQACAASGAPPGPYALQAGIAACHARATKADETDWRAIVALYDELVRRIPSPVIALNRAVAVSMAFGPEAGLAIVDELADEPSLAGYHLLPSVRGDLLSRLGRGEEARAEFTRAASITRNQRERALLLERARACPEKGERRPEP